MIAPTGDAVAATDTVAADAVDATVGPKTLLDRSFAWVYRRLGARYPRLMPGALLPLGILVGVGGVLTMRAYVDMTGAQLAQLVALTVALFTCEALAVVLVVGRQAAPVQRWLHGDESDAAWLIAFEASISLPLRVVRHPLPYLLGAFLLLTFSVVAVALLDLSWTALAILIPGGLLVHLYWLVLSFLAVELAARPVLLDLTRDHPGNLHGGLPRLPLRARLLLTLPAVNVITGVIVAGVGTGAGEGDVGDLALGIGAAVAVSLTVSVVLTSLLAVSIIEPLDQLRAATARIASGDFSTGVPVTSTDETGELATAFNGMIEGLREREALHHAFGVFVDPGLTERVLAEGTDLAGAQLDVSALFLDVRGFTAFAEGARPDEVVARLNALYEEVVPIVMRHGGMANQFIGDGLFALFGAPVPLDDHADRAVAAALEIGSRRDRPLDVGIGVSSGPALVGTIGGGGRKEFTAIGDTVNTAARVEAATRLTGDVILVTESTLAHLQQPEVCEWVERPDVPLKGKIGAVRLFAPESPPVGQPTR